ncbi:MAG: carbamoyl-phosphate synthase large subunit [Planctomycetota bacterium]|nr:carbamoyl-phosphate synthase large subunit [Planctomycetota bacterium]
MPKRTDLSSILILGSGPIVIGQACEFDYSGTQAVKALKEEGYRVVLVNSNPATIMTDPELADRTYVEPLTYQAVARIVERERPDALLPTMGGQTALNLAMELHGKGVLERYGVEMIGAKPDAIHRAEDREAFKETMTAIGLDLPVSALARNMDEARVALEEIGFPAVIRPAYTLGGWGGGVAYNVEEYEEICTRGLAFSMVSEILIEESLVGWKEFEMEVMRDVRDNVVIICSIENVDAMGVHTGDSVTVAPAQTLTDREYQWMRDASLQVIRAIGVETGGSNIQFAVHPGTGRMFIIEMNPRVSRSSALASKATGFPIAKFAAKLAVGYTLDEIRNDITRETPASFEPTIDYVVTKVPRFTFEKFPEADPTLTTQMKSVGETMAIGRTFKESLQKALRGLEVGRYGLGADGKDPPEEELDLEQVRRMLSVPNSERLFYVRLALRAGIELEEIGRLSHIDLWFLDQIAQIVEREEQVRAAGTLSALDDELFREAKRDGFSDRQIGFLLGVTEKEVRADRRRRGLKPVYKLVDTCAGEFKAYTPYYYSTYEQEDEVREAQKPRIVILGGGPNRIGQGIEFDYCCCHASFALKEIGFETVMINSNPETVSTDYDTSDLLFFEPLTVEDVLHVIERVQPVGVIVQFGGQTPLNLARELEEEGVPILGTSVDSIDRASDRERFQALAHELGIKQPRNEVATNVEQAVQAAARIGYPCIVRPSYVLGGRAMEIVFDEEALRRYMALAVDASPDKPVLLDRFMQEAIEIDVDAIADESRLVIAGIMEHIEEAGIHSGDSACTLPCYSLDERVLGRVRELTERIGKALEVRGLMNVQFIIQDGEVYVIEVNPRASRTVPFVAKAIGRPLARLAAQVMAGKTLTELGFTEECVPTHFSVKEPVFPFARFPGTDIILGPEMRSTGEVMGIAPDFGVAFSKAMDAAGQELPDEGNVFLSVRPSDRKTGVFLGRRLTELGLRVFATPGTYAALQESGVKATLLHKIGQGRPDVLDALKNDELDLIINTPVGKGAHTDEGRIRAAAVQRGVPILTTISGAAAAVNGIAAMRKSTYDVQSLQEYHAAAAAVSK